MDIVAIAARKLKEWGKSRPQLDIEESATWFLLSFIYAHGLTTDELGFKWSGIIPEVTVPQASLVMALLCLAVSVVVLIEPVLPSKMPGMDESYQVLKIRTVFSWIQHTPRVHLGYGSWVWPS